jgi:hypothetical protein
VPDILRAAGSIVSLIIARTSANGADFALGSFGNPTSSAEAAAKLLATKSPSRFTQVHMISFCRLIFPMFFFFVTGTGFGSWLARGKRLLK